MKHLLLMGLLTLSSLSALANEGIASTEGSGDQSIAVKIPKDFNLKNKVSIVNYTPNRLTRAVVEYIDASGSHKSIGTVVNVMPGETRDVAVFKKSFLKNLRGSYIDVTLNGKSSTGEETQSSDYKVQLSENDHNLLVEVYSNDKGVIFKKIPKDLDIKDKIFIVNRSSYTIVHAAVAYLGSNGTYIPIASMDKLAPGETHELIAYSDNELRDLCGKVIAIKVKGQTADDADKSTYNFDATLSEDRHDLYIEVSSGHGGALMDF